MGFGGFFGLVFLPGLKHCPQGRHLNKKGKKISQQRSLPRWERWIIAVAYLFCIIALNQDALHSPLVSPAVLDFPGLTFQLRLDMSVVYGETYLEHVSMFSS